MTTKFVKIVSTVLLLASLPVATYLNGSNTQPEEERLLPMMQELMVQMNRINTGMYMRDFRLIDTTAHNIAHHPKIAKLQLEKIKKALGPEIKKFQYYDLQIVHHHADSLSMAAQRENMEEVLEHYQIVQQGCVNCHTDFRDKLRKVLHPDQY